MIFLLEITLAESKQRAYFSPEKMDIVKVEVGTIHVVFEFEL